MLQRRIFSRVLTARPDWIPCSLRPGTRKGSSPRSAIDSPSPGERSERPPRLVLCFAVYTAIALILAGGAIVWFVRDQAIERAEQGIGFHARFVADTILRDRLHPADFADAVEGSRRAELDRLFQREVLVEGAVRVKLYRPDGLVTYSNEHGLIGTAASERGEIGRAIAGESIQEVSSLNREGGSEKDGKVIEAYAPVRLGEQSAPVGVFELYQDYASPLVAGRIRSAFLPVVAVLGLALLLLYASLFPILRGVTARLRRQALYDGLTGMPNRSLFRDRVQQALSQARREQEGVAVLLLDLDRFKEVNDTLGHGSGDLLLRSVGERLCSLMRESDTVARLGGDEFAVLAPRGADPASAYALAERIRSGLAQSFDVAGITLDVGASIGIALFPEDGQDVETLLRHADVAMYVAKGTHVPTRYTAEADQYSPERLSLVSELRQAIENRELTLVYQPQAELGTGEVTVVEALVRWQHPKHGLLTPDVFIPLAEHTGLIRQLTSFVLEESLRQLGVWRREGIDLSVAVNISGPDLLDLHFPDEVEVLLDRCEVDPIRLELEITENTILTDPTRARVVLDRLNELGVRLAIDDFGSGHSSLGYLKRLPVDVLKIDRSFVFGMQEDANDAVIVRSTIDLGHNLGLSVVAEGVENEQVWTLLDALECDKLQGYCLSRPVPAEELSAWLLRRGASSEEKLAS